MMSIFSPAPHIERLPEGQIDSTYKRLRKEVFAGTFIGYATFYLIRQNFSLAVPYMIAEYGYTKADLGIVMTLLSVAYGISKFVMGNASDRSNPKYFSTVGLLLSALVMLLFGTLPGVLSSIPIMCVLAFLNGWFQGMGWPPCGRTMVHWWSKSERGTIVSIWNTAHNIGGMMPGAMVLLASAVFFSTHGIEAQAKDIWQQSLYYPGIAAMICAIPVYFVMRDTPQSCGLPSIEKWRNDYPDDYNEKTYENDLSTKEIFVTYVLKNKLLWYIAIANVFVYLIRYGVLKWSPVYLSEVKHFNIKGTAWAYTIYELAAVPGTLLCGWVSDKVFKGKRGLTGFIFMILTTAAVVAYWMNPATPEAELANYSAWYENPYQLTDFVLMTLIGFLIYGPVMLIGLHALELAPKKAAGTAAGFTGLFGYLGGTVSASAVIGWAAQHYGWDGGFYVMIGGGVLAVLLLFIVMVEEGKHKAKLGDTYGK